MNKVNVFRQTFIDLITGDIHFELLRIAFVSNEYLLDFCQSMPEGFFTSIDSRWQLPVGEKVTCEASGITYIRH